MNLKNILVPTDFTPYSQHALDWACDFASKFSAQLHLVHVADESITEDRHRELMQELAGSVDADDQLKLRATCTILAGAPAAEIIRFARKRQVDLIVMGTHARTGLAHFAKGSVEERVVRSTKCPVLVVKPDGFVEANIDLESAIEILVEAHGDGVAGTRAEGPSEFCQTLASSLSVPESEAERIVSSLQDQGAVVWSPSDPSNGQSPEAGGVWRLDGSSIGQPAESTVNISPAADLIQRALKLGATDIHLDPAGEEMSVRFRIDGRLEQYCTMASDVADHLIHQYKMMSGIDIADPFHPKEGRLQLPASISDVEARVTTSPVAGGEAVALRLFARENVFFPLSQLGMTHAARVDVEKMLHAGEGIILVTGPTGAGKTTTVYSMLEAIGTSNKNIVSIEDPVEFAAPFVRQMCVDERHSISMATGLRTLLRMDPDIIFVGEIRDTEAAEIAMRAASSGRHVFSTLHTRDAAATFTALRDLNIDNRSLSANVVGVVSQRLVRRLCCHCRQTKTLTDEQRALFGRHQIEPPVKLAEPKGCESCRGTGYHGRTGVFEVALVSNELSHAIARGESEDQLRDAMRRHAPSVLIQAALQKVQEGVTSLEAATSLMWL